MGSKGITGLDGKKGPPGNNVTCFLGRESESHNVIGKCKLINAHSYN